MSTPTDEESSHPLEEERDSPERDNLSFFHVQPASLSQGYESEPICRPTRCKSFGGKMVRLRCLIDRNRMNEWKFFKRSLDERRLCQAVSLNDYGAAIQLLKRGVSANCWDRHDRTPLHLAACKGYSHVVRLLLKYGANPNIRDSVGNTPLHLAACTHHIDVVMLLLQAGTDACSIDRLGRSPLELAQSKLRILQKCSDPADAVKHQVSQVIDMLMLFSSTQSNLLTEFREVLHKHTETREQVDNQLQNLLDNLSSMSLESGPSGS